MIFKTCPYCGANLDPQETCDCIAGAQRDDNKKTNEGKNEYG